MMHQSATLASYVEGLPALLRSRLSSVTWHGSEGVWRLNYHLYEHETTGLNEQGETDPLTEMGMAPITMARLTRLPNDRLVTQALEPESARAELREMHLSGLVGNLNVAWIGRNLHAKTRAGSDAERWEWLTGSPYPHRPTPKMVYPTSGQSASDAGRMLVLIGRDFPRSANEEIKALGGRWYPERGWKVRRRDIGRAKAIVERHGGAIREEAIRAMGVER